MEIATIIAAVAGVFMGVAYAMLSRVYPRSGGDYVFMSRILSPPIGLTLSVSLMFWQLFYTGINGAWLAKYGLSPMFATLAIQLHSSHLLSLSNWLAGRWGLFTCGLFVILFFIGLLARGIGSLLPHSAVELLCRPGEPGGHLRDPDPRRHPRA